MMFGESCSCGGEIMPKVFDKVRWRQFKVFFIRQLRVQSVSGRLSAFILACGMPFINIGLGLTYREILLILCLNFWAVHLLVVSGRVVQLTMSWRRPVKARLNCIRDLQHDAFGYLLHVIRAVTVVCDCCCCTGSYPRHILLRQLGRTFPFFNDLSELYTGCWVHLVTHWGFLVHSF